MKSKQLSYGHVLSLYTKRGNIIIFKNIIILFKNFKKGKKEKKNKMTNAFKNLTTAKQITNRKLKYRKFPSQKKKTNI